MAIEIHDENGNNVEQDLHLFKDQKCSLVKTEAVIKVPLSFLLLCDQFIKYIQSNEYALLYNVKRIGNTLTWVLDPSDVYVPKQRVTSASVEFLEPALVQRYNGVVHRHPSGCKKFSETDRTKLNSLFSASFIYIPYLTTPDAIVNINVDDVARIQVPATVEVEDDVSSRISFQFVDGGFKPVDGAITALLKELYPNIFSEVFPNIKDIVMQISITTVNTNTVFPSNLGNNSVNVARKHFQQGTLPAKRPNYPLPRQSSMKQNPLDLVEDFLEDAFDEDFEDIENFSNSQIWGKVGR